MAYIGFDIGGTFIKFGVLNEHGEILEKDKAQTKAESAEQFIALLAEIVLNYEKKYTIDSIGLSFPGTIDTSTGTAVLAGALEHLHGTPIVQMLTHQLGKRYPVFIENDANAAAMAEKNLGNAQTVDDFTLITIGTGIGGGVFKDGQIMNGFRYKVGEYGMMITDFSRSGYKTLHELASTSSLVRRYAEFKGVATSEVTGQQILADSEPAVQDLIEDWANYLAITIFNVVTSFDPQLVLLGGGISQNVKLLPIVGKALERIPYWHDFKVPIQTCRFFNDAGLIGAMVVAKKGLENQELAEINESI